MPISAGMALFASLIIRTFQLIFSAETVFFSHNKSAGTVFRLVFSAKRTGLTQNDYSVQEIRMPRATLLLLKMCCKMQPYLTFCFCLGL